MTATLPEMHTGHGNHQGVHIEPPPRGTIKRAITIMQFRADVMSAWRDAGFPDDATFNKAPGDKGTVVSVSIPDVGPTTALGSAFETLMKKNPAEAVEKALAQFKAKVETGEMPTTDGQPTGEIS